MPFFTMERLSKVAVIIIFVRLFPGVRSSGRSTAVHTWVTAEHPAAARTVAHAWQSGIRSQYSLHRVRQRRDYSRRRRVHCKGPPYRQTPLAFVHWYVDDCGRCLPINRAGGIGNRWLSFFCGTVRGRRRKNVNGINQTV